MNEREVERRAVTDDGRWHLKKEIQLGHVFTTVTVAFSCFVYVNKIENRLAIVERQTEVAVTAQRDRDERQDKSTADLVAMLRTQLERMESKLDRIVEKKP